jgi:pimeloyl-ACP methyl ester carboxylesterase
MDEPISFGSVQSKFFAAYNRGAYAEALDQVTREGKLLPQYEAVFLCWRAALLARMNDPADAIRLLKAAYDAGYWYHEEALLGDPDFAVLRELPDFQAQVLHNRFRRQEAQAQISPTLTVMTPSEPAANYPLLLALHGSLGNSELFVHHWQSAVDLGWVVAVPQSSQPMWVSGFYDWSDQDRASAEIQQHIETLLYDYSIDRIVVAGFSMGGILAQRLVWSGLLKAKGLCLVEGWSLDELTQTPTIAGDLPRSVLVAGDTFADEATRALAAIQAHGITCAFERTSNQYHSFAPEFPDVLARALRFLAPA